MPSATFRSKSRSLPCTSGRFSIPSGSKNADGVGQRAGRVQVQENPKDLIPRKVEADLLSHFATYKCSISFEIGALLAKSKQQGSMIFASNRLDSKNGPEFGRKQSSLSARSSGASEVENPTRAT